MGNIPSRRPHLSTLLHDILTSSSARKTRPVFFTKRTPFLLVGRLIAFVCTIFNHPATWVHGVIRTPSSPHSPKTWLKHDLPSTYTLDSCCPQSTGEILSIISAPTTTPLSLFSVHHHFATSSLAITMFFRVPSSTKIPTCIYSRMHRLNLSALLNETPVCPSAAIPLILQILHSSPCEQHKRWAVAVDSYSAPPPLPQAKSRPLYRLQIVFDKIGVSNEPQ